MALIYVVTNKINNKKYVGLTTRKLHERWSGHCNGVKRADNDTLLGRAIAKYGDEAFIIEALEELKRKLVLRPKGA